MLGREGFHIGVHTTGLSRRRAWGSGYGRAAGAESPSAKFLVLVTEHVFNIRVWFHCKYSKCLLNKEIKNGETSQLR